MQPSSAPRGRASLHPLSRRLLLAVGAVAAGMLALVAGGQAVVRSDPITTIAGGGTKPPGGRGSAVSSCPQTGCLSRLVAGNGTIPTERRFSLPGTVAVSPDGKVMMVGDYQSDRGGTLDVVLDLSQPRNPDVGIFELGYAGDKYGGIVLDGEGTTAYYAVGCRIEKRTAPKWDLTLQHVAGLGGCGFGGDGGPARSSRLGADVRGLALDTDGRLYIADHRNHRVRYVDTRSGVIDTFAGTGVAGESGDGGQAAQARLTNPVAVAVDGSQNVYIATSTRVRKVTPGGKISTLFDVKSLGNVCRTARGPDIAGMAIDRSGTVYVSIWTWHQIYAVSPSGSASRLAGRCSGGYAGDGGEAGTATLNAPWALATDASGNLYIADLGNDRIRFIRNIPPRATLKATPTSGTAPLTVTFDARGSVDPDGSIHAYSYKFRYPRSAPGTPRLSRSTPVRYTYSTPGRYTATVTVTDDRGASSLASVRITVR